MFAKIRRSVHAVDDDLLRAVLILDVHLKIFKHLGNFFFILDVNALAYCVVCRGSVHRARVKIDDAEIFCNGFCYRAFACACRSVDCYIYHIPSEKRENFSFFCRAVKHIDFDIALNISIF